MDPATIIARSPGATTVIRSDEVAARLLQGVNRDKSAGKAGDAAGAGAARSGVAAARTKTVEPVDERTGRRKGQRPDTPARGLDGLRAGVSRYQEAVAWLRQETALFPRALGYVALLAEDARPIITVSEILLRLRADPSAFDPPHGVKMPPAPVDLPFEIDVAPVLTSAEIDVSRSHLALVRWSEADDTLRVGHDTGGLWLEFELGVRLGLVGLDLARSITIRRGAEVVTLRPDPEPPMVGLIDAVL